MIENSAPVSDRRVLVVGGNGFIGRHVVRAFLDAGAQVAIMDTAPAPAEFAALDQVIGSVADPTLMASAASGAHIVVFLANSSLPGSANSDLSSEVRAHVETTVKAAEICASLGVERFLFASSGGTVYGYSSDTPLTEERHTAPKNAYGVSKLSIEHYLRIITSLREMQCVALRISNPYGEGQRAVRNQGFVAAAMQHAVRGQTLPIWGDGSVIRDFLHISDVARAFVLAGAVPTPPEVVNIGSGQGVSLVQILDLIQAALGRDIDIAFEPGRAIDVRKNVLDTTRARDLLGWHPQVDLATGLQRTADWWLSL
ncbi:NAD-dependent epimerase/dehydratase family protein [Fluviibacterium sp. DFM31]|uniref:NAD-dependent epimerase/dehydratase family protein n=1 Tax=Meridianimarinicoccus marinus TaxID=3231483 RepID=A0ABV3L9A5_9RHOB